MFLFGKKATDAATSPLNRQQRQLLLWLMLLLLFRRLYP
jgi:hypothetical protein